MPIKIVDKHNIETKSKRTKNQAGYLVLPDCVIARAGILQYSDVTCEDGETVADGAIIYVMRPNSALKNCYKQFANLPLTLQHPDDDAVTPENAKGLTVGTLGSNPKYEERDGVGCVICDIVVYDEETQKQIESGNCVELSAGYETAFRKKRGVSDIGQTYEAEQFYLCPNHVALVERGRCGSECKVCDKKEEPLKHKIGVKDMAKKKTDKFRYFLAVGDGDDVVELTEEQAKQMQEKEPDLEVEELDEDEVELEDVDVSGVDTDDADMDKDDEDEELDETEEEENDEEEDGTCPECGKEPCECDEDEETEETEEETEETEETEEEDEDEEGGEELTFEVQFEDGSIGKMDKVAYEHTQRFLDVAKKGDKKCGDSLSTVLALTSRASKIIGPKFDIETYTKGDSVDTEAIKRDVIRKAMPGVVVSGLRGHALDSLYKSAVKTYAKKKDSYEKDLSRLCDVAPSIVQDKAVGQDMVSVARKKFMERIHKK